MKKAIILLLGLIQASKADMGRALAQPRRLRGDSSMVQLDDSESEDEKVPHTMTINKNDPVTLDEDEISMTSHKSGSTTPTNSDMNMSVETNNSETNKEPETFGEYDDDIKNENEIVSMSSRVNFRCMDIMYSLK